jgi:uncharacterized membrane protein (UPF0127 family)
MMDLRRSSLPVLLAVLSVVVPVRSALPSADDPDCPRWRRAFLAMPTRPLVMETAKGGRVSVGAKVAATNEARWAGFQCARADEIRRAVILFDFGREVLGEFHMRNVPAPLDIAFAKASGRIFAIRRMEPSPTATWGPFGLYRYAIEARAGFFSEHGIAPGDAVVLHEST